MKLYRMWKTECLNGHTTASSVQVSSCVHCGAPFKASVEWALTLSGLVLTDTLTGEQLKKVSYAQLLGGNNP